MKCIKCKITAKFMSEDKVSNIIQKRWCECPKCGSVYERVVLRDSIGLIKDDMCFEIDKDGNHVKIL